MNSFVPRSLHFLLLEEIAKKAERLAEARERRGQIPLCPFNLETFESLVKDLEGNLWAGLDTVCWDIGLHVTLPQTANGTALLSYLRSLDLQELVQSKHVDATRAMRITTFKCPASELRITLFITGTDCTIKQVGTKEVPIWEAVCPDPLAEFLEETPS